MEAKNVYLFLFIYLFKKKGFHDLNSTYKCKASAVSPFFFLFFFKINFKCELKL